MAKFLLIFDVGQTLCYNCETYEEFTHNQSAVLYRAFIEKVSNMSAAELDTIGMSTLPLEKIVKNSESYEKVFAASMTDTIVKFKDLKNASYISKEVGLDFQFVKTLLTADPFHCGLTESQLSAGQLKALEAVAKGLLQNDKCIVAKYAAFEGLKELLAKYQADPRFRLAICTNTSYAKKQRAIVHQCGLDHFFDAAIVSSEVGVRKPNPEILNLLKTQYPQFRDYQICIIGDMIDRDILCGKNANVRTLWFTQKQFDPAVNYKKLKECEPDFTFSQYAQLPGIVELMLKDAEYLEEQKEEVQKNYKSPENYRNLPSQQLLRVGYYFPPLLEPAVIQSCGYAIPNGHVVYYPYQLDCPFDVQPSFSVFIYHGVDIHSDQRFASFLQAAKERKIALVNSLGGGEALGSLTEKFNEILANQSVIDLVAKQKLKVKVLSLAAAKENVEDVYRVTCIGRHVEVLRQESKTEGDVTKELLANLTQTIGELLGVHLLSIEYLVDEAKGECYLANSRSVYEKKLHPEIEVSLNKFLEEHSKLITSS